MKTLPILLGVGAAVYLGTRAFNVGQSVNKLEYYNPRIKFGKVSLSGIQATITLDIKNPGSSDIYLDYFTGNITYAGSRLSTFTFNPQSGSNVWLKGRQLTTIPFIINISNLGALQTIIKIINCPQQRHRFKHFDCSGWQSLRSWY